MLSNHILQLIFHETSCFQHLPTHYLVSLPSAAHRCRCDYLYIIHGLISRLSYTVPRHAPWKTEPSRANKALTKTNLVKGTDVDSECSYLPRYLGATPPFSASHFQLNKTSKPDSRCLEVDAHPRPYIYTVILRTLKSI